MGEKGQEKWAQTAQERKENHKRLTKPVLLVPQAHRPSRAAKLEDVLLEEEKLVTSSLPQAVKKMQLFTAVELPGEAQHKGKIGLEIVACSRARSKKGGNTEDATMTRVQKERTKTHQKHTETSTTPRTLPLPVLAHRHLSRPSSGLRCGPTLQGTHHGRGTT